MDRIWFNREEIDNRYAKEEKVFERQFKTPGYWNGDREVIYDAWSGLYLLEEEPFTGVMIGRGPHGVLRSLVHFLNGLEEGVSASWFDNGQICTYLEMSNGVVHGWEIEWSEDGSKIMEEYCQKGKPVDPK